MLLQTNSYVVPKEKRNEHARLVRRFRQTLARLGCNQFEVYEQVSQNWGGQDSGGRFVQIMRFRDRRHQLDVQANERSDPAAQALIQEFCELINFPFQQQQGLFAVGFYSSVLPGTASREQAAPAEETSAPPAKAKTATAAKAGAAPVAKASVPGHAFPEDQAAKLRAVAEATFAEEAKAHEAAEPHAANHASEAPVPSAHEMADPGSGAAGLRETSEPVYFEDTLQDAPAHSKPSEHPGPSRVDDELDSGLTDLSDSKLLNLPELSASDGPALEEGDFSAHSEPKLKLAQPVESHEVEAMLERADERFTDSEGEEELAETHLEGHNSVEPVPMERARRDAEQAHKPPSAHPHMRLAQDHDSNGQDEPSDVQLFEPDEPVSPFGT